MSANLKGATLVLLSALVFSFAGIFTKSIVAGPLVILCWRGLIGGVLIAGYVIWRGQEKLNPGWRGMVLAIIGSLASLAFVASFRKTWVANVALIWATAPFVVAGLAYLMLQERPAGRVLIAGVISLAGMAIMVSGGVGGIGNRGDLYAFLMTFGMSLYIVLIRYFRDVPVVWSGGISALLLILPGMHWADPFGVSSRDLILLFGFGASFAIAAILLTEGTRLIPAATSGLIGTAEVPFAILLALIILGEVPPPASAIGGVLVLCAVIWNGWADYREAA